MRVVPAEPIAVARDPDPAGASRVARSSQVSRDCSTRSPGPVRPSNTTVRPHAANIRAAPGPRIGSPWPHVRPVSSSRSSIPRRRRRGKKPSCVGLVRKSRTRATWRESGRCGSPRGIRTSAPCTNTSVRPESGPVTGGLSLWSAWRRSISAISAAGACARRRASASIPRSILRWRRPLAINPQKPSAKSLTRCAATVLTSQPTHKLGVANWSASRLSISEAMALRSSATAANTHSRSTGSSRTAAEYRAAFPTAWQTFHETRSILG